VEFFNEELKNYFEGMDDAGLERTIKRYGKYNPKDEFAKEYRLHVLGILSEITKERTKDNKKK